MIYQACYFNASRRLIKEVTLEAGSLTEAIEIILEQPNLKPPPVAESIVLRILPAPTAA